YLPVLLGLAWAIAAAQQRGFAVRIFQGTLACALAIQFATQFETRYFELWAFDLPAKEVARHIQEDSRGKSPNSVSVSATWYQTPALEFYRRYYEIETLKPVERRAKTLLTGFDYYVLNLKDDDEARTGDRSHLVPLYSEPISGVLLAKEAGHAQ